MSTHDPYLPRRAPIDAYGGGGFRFAGMSHRGSLLVLPSGMYAWPVETGADILPDAFARVFDEAADTDFLLLGTGAQWSSPPLDVSKAFLEAGIGLEIMDTGAACRTYNVLLGEARAVAAALLAVE